MHNAILHNAMLMSYLNSPYRHAPLSERHDCIPMPVHGREYEPTIPAPVIQPLVAFVYRIV